MTGSDQPRRRHVDVAPDHLQQISRCHPHVGIAELVWNALAADPPDMFWVDVSVLLPNGQPPQAAEAIEPYLGRNWRRFSWHRQGWNPSVDNLHGYLEFIRRRLREKK